MFILGGELCNKQWLYGPNGSMVSRILGLKSLNNSYIPVVTNNHDLFHFWSKENLRNFQKVCKYYKHYCLKIFYVFINSFTSLKQSHYGCNSLYLSKKRPIPNLKGFQNHIWTSVIRSKKHLSSKSNFVLFSELAAIILG